MAWPSCPSLILAFCLVIQSMLAHDTSAQAYQDDFSGLELRLGYARDISADPVQEFWKTKSAYSFALATPLFGGIASAGAQYQPFSGRFDQYPSFKSTYLSLAWGYRWHDKNNGIYETGARLGNFYMVFDDDTFEGVRNESELAMSLYQSVKARISGRSYLFIKGTYTRVYTNTRMNLFHIGAGLIVEVRMPKWLKTFLE